MTQPSNDNTGNVFDLNTGVRVKPSAYEYGGGSGGGTVDNETKNYVDAKAEAVKAQNDARFAEVVSGIDKLGTLVTSQGEVIGERFNTIEDSIKTAETAANDAKAAASATKWNIFFTGLTVAALAFGGFALWNQAIEMTTGILSSPQGIQANDKPEESPPEGQN